MARLPRFPADLRAGLAGMAVMTAMLCALSGCAAVGEHVRPNGGVDDIAITTAVKARFVDDRRLDASTIEVRSRNGTVRLSGSVRNADEKAGAESIARGVAGVRDVRNDIEVRR